MKSRNSERLIKDDDSDVGLPSKKKDLREEIIKYRRYFIESELGPGNDLSKVKIHSDFLEPTYGDRRHYGGWFIDKKTGRVPLKAARYLSKEDIIKFAKELNEKKIKIEEVFNHGDGLDRTIVGGYILYVTNDYKRHMSGKVYGIEPPLPETTHIPTDVSTINLDVKKESILGFVKKYFKRN